MSVDENKRLARRFLEETFNDGRLEVVDELCAPEYVEHQQLPPGISADREGLKQLIKLYRGAFPNARITVEDEIAEGDKVVTRWTGDGTHQGPLFGTPATGRRVRVTGIDISRFQNGRIVEHWGELDQLGMLQQIGAVPLPAEPATTAV